MFQLGKQLDDDREDERLIAIDQPTGRGRWGSTGDKGQIRHRVTAGRPAGNRSFWALATYFAHSACQIRAYSIG